MTRQDLSDGMNSSWKLPFGASVSKDEGLVNFRVWAPFARKVELLLSHQNGEQSCHRMEKATRDFHDVTVTAKEGDMYFYLVDGEKKRPDPASRFQPEGVHKKSQIVDPASFSWTDDKWRGLDQEELLIYELHVGTFTDEGTFEAIVPYMDYLKNELGVTAIELMPVAQFPGSRNWGYDGVDLYSPQNTYGGPVGLKRLVDRCHSSGLAVILDVVYNHFGPEGNYLNDFGPYFSYRYRTPWGPAINYDESGCDQVREFIINNALYWINEYHFDGLRLDAIHGVFDNSPKNILQEIGEAVHVCSSQLGKNMFVIAESDLNSSKIVTPVSKCGYGLDAQWSDDFHHSIHAYLTGERFGYYQDFGSIHDITKSIEDGFVYDGKYSPYRGRKHGTPSVGIDSKRFVISIQTHDQVGNRADGNRLTKLIDADKLKVAAGLLILSPYIPLLFMGEEYGETTPFYYFTSHSDPDLAKMVSDGRRSEFEANGWHAACPDPQDPLTYKASILDHSSRLKPSNKEIFQHYRELIRIRKTYSALKKMDKSNTKIDLHEEQKALVLQRQDHQGKDIVSVYVLGGSKARLHFGTGTWTKIYDSKHPIRYKTSDFESLTEFPPYSMSVYVKERERI